jgi:hypothetical protein
MHLSRIIVTTTGLFLIALAIPCLLAPENMAHGFGLALLSPGGLVEFQAVHGGLMLALGAYLMVISSRPAQMVLALETTFFILSGLFVGHVYGIYTHGCQNPLIWMLVILETFGVIMTINARMYHVETSPNVTSRR